MTLPDATAATTSAPDADQERWNAYWSRWAAEYDDHQLTRLAQPGERETWTRIWESALPSSAREVLDVGTGSGTVALLVAATGRDVTGIDLAGGMLERARAKAADHPHPPRFLPGDAVAPPFAPGGFDAIVSRYLLWTLRDAPAALRAWHDLLRPGGTLAAIDARWFAPDGSLPQETERQAHFAAAYDEDAFARLRFGTADLERIRADWEAAGFTDVQVRALPELLELDRAHGMAPGHSPALQHLITARRAD